MSVRGREFCKEDVLRAHDGLSVDDCGTAETGLPEREIEDVMQTERDQCTLEATEEECADVARRLNERAEFEDAFLYERPDEVHYNAGDDAECHVGNRHETGTAEECKCRRKLLFVEFIADPR